MTIIFEISKPFRAKPGKYESELMTRYWWLWFAIGFLKVSFPDFCRTDKVWEE